MNRKTFVKTSAWALAFFPFTKINAMLISDLIPETYFFENDGVIPNSKYPLLVYRNAFSERGNSGAEWLESKFKANNWYNSWRYGIYPFHHYHSNTHEVLGIFQGSAEIMTGGPKGKKMKISAGDIIIIPAGVGHQCLSHSDDFTVVGAYPDGMEPDLVREDKSKYTTSVHTIEKVKIPSSDPLLGTKKGLIQIWK
ncbi:cupin domain-containing protein [Chryseobacterium sp. MYb264]|uniref:cupin domain-containing protein n=1 Tax=Chryseobacterium sp. MYb264 TaxID=2745153 RepID=UPI002E12ABD3|nr:cupin domain-containing protein [Chryseobacterium sp. MYb264]